MLVFGTNNMNIIPNDSSACSRKQQSALVNKNWTRKS